MNPDLRQFIAQWLRTALMAGIPVILTAFLSIPLSLGAHPGDPGASGRDAPTHMT